VSGLLEAVEGALAAGGEADDVLRSVVAALVEEPGVQWAGIAFLEDGELVVGPHVGAPDEARRTCVPVVYEGSTVGELWVDGTADQTALEPVAERVADYVLVGWDTGGEGWQP
jgi:putative methionine-R-sulfoxide reductase with GAF domain